MYCDGDAVVDVDIDMSILVEEWLMFMCAVLVGVGMVVFIMLVVEVLVPEYAVYATESLLMDDIIYSGILLSAMVCISAGMVLISGMAVVAAGVISIEDSPAAPQRVLANVLAASKHSATYTEARLGNYLQVWSSAEHPEAIAVRSASTTGCFAQIHAKSVIAHSEAWIAASPACCWRRIVSLTPPKT